MTRMMEDVTIISLRVRSDVTTNSLLLTWWRHQMETFSALLALCAGNSPHKGQWRGALMFSLICAWTNSWANNGDSGDLRRHRAHYGVIVMKMNTNIGGCYKMSLLTRKRHVNYCEITACVLYSIIAKFLLVCLRAFPILARQVFRIFNCLSLDKE